MNDYSQEGAGKISLHGNGMGLPSLEEVEKRAREIAMIDERNPDEFTDAEWAQARQELLGAEHPTPPEETKQNAELTEDWYVAAALFCSSRRRHTIFDCDWSSDVCSSDLMIRHTRFDCDWSSDVCSSD